MIRLCTPVSRGNLTVYEVLQAAGLEVVVATAREARAVPGRKSDVNDAKWPIPVATHGSFAQAKARKRSV